MIDNGYCPDCGAPLGRVVGNVVCWECDEEERNEEVEAVKEPTDTVGTSAPVRVNK